MKNKIDEYMAMPECERMKHLKDETDDFRQIVFDEMKKELKKERKEKYNEYWKNLDKKFINNYDIPTIPVPIEQLHIDKLIELGAIAKKDLIVGKYYYGKCRNADVAMWDGKVFQHMRYKFGYYNDNVNHFEDDNGYDLFVPLKITEPKENEFIK